MSRHLHHAVSSDVEHILHDVNHLPKEEISSLYGFEIMEDGTVFDPVANRYFESISVWATFEAEQDEMDYSEHFGHGKQTHEDFG